MYLLGDTENKNSPLILTIGREANDDSNKLSDEIKPFNNKKFKEILDKVWVGLMQYAKKYLGKSSGAGKLKKLCFARNSSPILFSNALPFCLNNKIQNKDDIREQ